ncbi:hypothetical protein MUK42_19655 [Musa troglodytarum]|uniref:Uncharacterized protein n=1 Tax=Musa troglodytarum TaxID=320322 RepID=A0A9E7H693_9LILI|nr:hypothetical protein MUK42_19655 [Musa troglodytarum]
MRNVSVLLFPASPVECCVVTSGQFASHLVCSWPSDVITSSSSSPANSSPSSTTTPPSRARSLFVVACPPRNKLTGPRLLPFPFATELVQHQGSFTLPTPHGADTVNKYNNYCRHQHEPYDEHHFVFWTHFLHHKLVFECLPAP